GTIRASSKSFKFFNAIPEVSDTKGRKFRIARGMWEYRGRGDNNNVVFASELQLFERVGDRIRTGGTVRGTVAGDYNGRRQRSLSGISVRTVLVHDLLYIFVEMIEENRLGGPSVRDRLTGLGTDEVLLDVALWGNLSFGDVQPKLVSQRSVHCKGNELVCSG
ncbi:hypothetical protein FB451DRAFT_1289977, partial [Mycena latifolia]